MEITDAEIERLEGWLQDLGEQYSIEQHTRTPFMPVNKLAVKSILDVVPILIDAYKTQQGDQILAVLKRVRALEHAVRWHGIPLDE